MATEVPLPASIYVEQLEEWLLLQAYSRLWRQQGGLSIPPADEEGSSALMAYAEQLQHFLPRHGENFFPAPPRELNT